MKRFVLCLLVLLLILAFGAGNANEVITISIPGDVVDGTHEHDWSEWVITKEPSCAEYGVKASTCSICGMTKQETISRTEDHTWSDWQVVSPADSDNTGVEQRTCSVCTKVDQRSIPKVADNSTGIQLTFAQTCFEKTSAATLLYVMDDSGNLRSAQTLPAGTYIRTNGLSAEEKTGVTYGFEQYGYIDGSVIVPAVETVTLPSGRTVTVGEALVRSRSALNLWLDMEYGESLDDQIDYNSLGFDFYPLETIDWFTGGINELWQINRNCKIYDVITGKVWWAHRRGGGYHIDAEPLRAADTATLCVIYGVSSADEISEKYHWQRRPCIVAIGEQTFACSLYGVPHNYPDGDTIADNNFYGEVCIHFTNSLSHAGNLDSGHQQAIREACDWYYGHSQEEHYYYSDGKYYSDESSHWLLCGKCGAKFEVGEHVADCLSPTVCAICDADNVIISRVDHKYTWNDYTSDSDYHWNQCTKCGSIVNNKMRHQVTHDNPNKCMVCGQENVTSFDIVHQLGNYESNTLVHWLGCEICGYVDHNDAEKHRVDCRNPSVCMLCGREDMVDPWVEHEFDYNDDYVIREDGHYQVCKNCGQEVLMNTHWASCRYPNKCAVCGASNVNIQYVNHGQQILKKDSLSHWYCCADCNEIMYGKSAHSMSCIAPDVCCVCGEEGLTTGQIGHRYVHNEYSYDSEKHWRECADCHEKRYGGHEASCDDPEKCVLCGAISVNISSVKHYGNVLIELTEEGHIYQCANCGRISTTPHYMGNCLRGSCNECGMLIDDMNNVEVDHTALLTGELEQNGHWMQCTQCGYRYLEAHTANCTAPQYCMTCGASGADYDYEVEHGSFKQEGNRIVCEICGLEHVHIFECWEDGVCSGCGVILSNVEGADVTHHFDPSFIKNSQGHYQVCRACGTTTEIESHTISQGVCMVCGYESRLPEDMFTWTESQGQATITGFYGKIASMIIPSTLNGLPVTAIGSRAFMDNTKLKSVVIPATVTSIGTYAFRGCTALQSISLPDQLTTISNYAFYGTSSLKEIYLAQSVSSIANAAFKESGLEAVTCYTASYAHQWATAKNYRLTLIPVYIDEESMILPRGLQSIDEEAFSGIAARRIVVPEGCASIGKKAFSFCADLEVLELPASVKSIDDSMMLGSEGVMILAPKGSYAVEWAERNHIQVIGK